MLQGYVSIIVLCSAVICYYVQRRSAHKVLSDLRESSKHTTVAKDGNNNTQKTVLRSPAEAAMCVPHEKEAVVIGALLGILLAFFMRSFTGVFIYPVFLASIAYLFERRRQSNVRVAHRAKIEEQLPIVMERLVMAVDAGLDVIAALTTLVALEGQQEDVSITSQDPILPYFKCVLDLAASGVPFDQALQEVAATTPCLALRHAFVHLALAYEDGGELIMPLRELSDASQLYYQESVDERIAALPVKATMPLVCTFAGLIIIFITTPLLQVVERLADLQLK